MAKKECYKCKTKYDESTMTQVLKHWLCPTCYEKYIVSVEYYKEKFINDVWQLYDKKPNFQQLKGQAEDFNSRYGFSYRGMSFALKYYLKEHEWNTKYLLYQAFPQAYYDAQDIFKKQESLRNSMHKSHEPKTITLTTRTVSYKPPLPL